MSVLFVMSSAKIGRAVRRAVHFITGHEDVQPTSPEYLELSEAGNELECEMFLVTYGSYGILPSFDPDCLAAICWLKMCRVPFTLEPSNEPDMSPNSRLPFLMSSTGKTTINEDVPQYAQCRANNLVTEGGESQICTAALAILLKSVKPALLAALWLDDPMRSKITKRNYARNYPWPISEYLIWSLRRQIRTEILYGKLLAEALDSLRTLSELLAESEYFGGKHPAWVDAVAYGLMAVALVILPPSHELRTMIETCSRLRAFVGRIRREYFD